MFEILLVKHTCGAELRGQNSPPPEKILFTLLYFISMKHAINCTHSTTNLTKEILFTHYKSVTVDIDSIFCNSIVPNSEFFQYIFELDLVFNIFFKK